MKKNNLNAHESLLKKWGCLSVVILIGIGIMEASHASHVRFGVFVLGMLPIIVAAFAYPLGNRKMMAICQGRLDAFQRTLGMTLASLPLWLLLALVKLSRQGLPSAH